LSHYGLIVREGGEVRVSPLAFKILHPVNPEQKAQGMKEAALNPKVFAEIHEKWSDMEELALSNNLIHQKFTPEGAKRAASVYKANYALANLGSASNAMPNGDATQPSASELADAAVKAARLDLTALVAPRPKVLATFKIPLGSTEAELIFTGDRLQSEDFDDLKEYVDLFKKQYERKLKTASEIEKFLGTPPASPA